MTGTWLRVLAVFLLVGLAAGYGGWRLMHGENATTDNVATEAPPPTSAQAAPSPAPLATRDSLVLPGIIEPYESIPVSAKLTASIAAMRVRDGSTVRKGQLLCLLEDTELRRDIDSAQLAVLQAEETLRRAREHRETETQRKTLALASAQQELASCQTKHRVEFQQAEVELKRADRELTVQEALYRAGAISFEQVQVRREAAEDARRSLEQRRASAEMEQSERQKAVEQARLDESVESVSAQDIDAYQLAAANTRAELAERKRRIKDLEVAAPVGGTVHFIRRTRTSSMIITGQSAEVLGPGVRVYEGDPFLEIATTERACVRIEVDETDVSRLQVGMKAAVTGDAFPGATLQGEVAEIQISGRRAGEGVTLFPVTVLITSPLGAVRMGMTADVTIKWG